MIFASFKQYGFWSVLRVYRCLRRWMNQSFPHSWWKWMSAYWTRRIWLPGPRIRQRRPGKRRHISISQLILNIENCRCESGSGYVPSRWRDVRRKFSNVLLILVQSFCTVHTKWQRNQRAPLCHRQLRAQHRNLPAITKNKNKKWIPIIFHANFERDKVTSNRLSNLQGILSSWRVNQNDVIFNFSKFTYLIRDTGLETTTWIWMNQRKIWKPKFSFKKRFAQLYFVNSFIAYHKQPIHVYVLNAHQRHIAWNNRKTADIASTVIATRSHSEFPRDTQSKWNNILWIMCGRWIVSGWTYGVYTAMAGKFPFPRTSTERNIHVTVNCVWILSSLN